MKEEKKLFDFVATISENTNSGKGDQATPFECQAEDYNHAKEQAENAYPDLVVVAVGYKDQKIASFINELGRAVNSMLQEDACGSILALEHNQNLELIAVPIDPEDMVTEMYRFYQYDMIIFDGGNSHGDRWKWTFYPQTLDRHFVNENPIPKAEGEKPPMEVSTDGGETWNDASEVRVIYHDLDLPSGEDGTCELHVILTHEGMITDAYVDSEDGEPENIGTGCLSYDEMLSNISAPPVCESAGTEEMLSREQYRDWVLNTYRYSEESTQVIMQLFRGAFADHVQTEEETDEDFLSRLIEQDYDSSSSVDDLCLQSEVADELTEEPF